MFIQGPIAEALGQFLGVWLILGVCGGVVGTFVACIIAWDDPDGFDEITTRKKWAWVIGILFWPFALGFMLIVGVLAIFNYRHPKVTRFSEWLGE